MDPKVRIINVPAGFQTRRYDRRIMLGASALPLVLLLEEIEQRNRIRNPVKWAVSKAQTDARLARKAARHIVRHDVEFAAARKGLIPGADEISIRPPRVIPKARKKRAR